MIFAVQQLVLCILYYLDSPAQYVFHGTMVPSIGTSYHAFDRCRSAEVPALPRRCLCPSRDSSVRRHPSRYPPKYPMAPQLQRYSVSKWPDHIHIPFPLSYINFSFLFQNLFPHFPQFISLLTEAEVADQVENLLDTTSLRLCGGYDLIIIVIVIVTDCTTSTLTRRLLRRFNDSTRSLSTATLDASLV